jgi:hypothetical protein
MSGKPEEQIGSSQLNERDQYLYDLMKDGRPIRVIAVLLGLQHDYTYKLCRKVIETTGLQYTPDQSKKRENWEAPVGITEESRILRGGLADALYDLCEEVGDPRKVAQMVGVPVRHQNFAKTKPFHYDWTLTQLQRLATAKGMTLPELLRKHLRDG